MAEPLLLWFRRDLRLADHPMLAAALDTGRPLIPVFVLDPETETLGAAAKLRLEAALSVFDARLRGLGSRLILRRGPASGVLAALIAETGAAGVMWSRLYDGAGQARDSAIKATLRAQGRIATSHPGFLLHEPWTVATAAGTPFQVFTPFWKAMRGLEVTALRPAPARLPAPDHWPASEALADWQLAAAMRRGADVLRPWMRVGEEAALARLAEFAQGPMAAYPAMRDALDAPDAVSGLSEPLTWGEIAPARIWHHARAAMLAGNPGAEAFLRQLGWRDFAWMLFHHRPDMGQANWRRDWDSFPWRGDNPDAEAWRRGLTGEPIIDAALREMFVTGRMHNRARMIVASFLTKHLLTHWRVGLDWFADCLTDWDEAANAMGWQWVAGSGPDAAPYFRVFNPATQADKFDPDQRYRRRWLATASRRPGAQALSYFDAVPRRWQFDPATPAPLPIISLEAGRARALAAYAQRKA